MVWIGSQSQANLVDLLFDTRTQSRWQLKEDGVETRVINLGRGAHAASRLTQAHTSPISHVALGLLNSLFELGREFHFVFDDAVEPFANLSKLNLRKLA